MGECEAVSGWQPSKPYKAYIAHKQRDILGYITRQLADQ